MVGCPGKTADGVDLTVKPAVFSLGISSEGRGGRDHQPRGRQGRLTPRQFLNGTIQRDTGGE